MRLQDFLDLVLPSEAPMATMAAKATAKSQPSVTEMTSRARNKAQEQYSKPPANGLTVPPPPQQRGLQMLNPQRIRPLMPVVNWQMPPAWPSEALEGQPIKLPRQTKVQQVRHNHRHAALSPCLCLSTAGVMPGRDGMSVGGELRLARPSASLETARGTCVTSNTAVLGVTMLATPAPLWTPVIHAGGVQRVLGAGPWGHL